jgi:hypothetical protein
MRLEGTHASSHSVGIYRSGIKIRRLFGATEATISVTALASHSRSLQLISRLIVPPIHCKQCLADATVVRHVTGSRVRLLCVDADDKFVIFGSNIGSVYVFERLWRVRGVGLNSGSRNEQDSDKPDDDRDALSNDNRDTPQDEELTNKRDYRDCSLKFRERFMVETRGGGSASRAVVAVKISPNRTRLALAFDDGELTVCEFSDPDDCHQGIGAGVSAATTSYGPLPRDSNSSSPTASGRYEAGVPSGHKGHTVTSVVWSPAGNAFCAGDDTGCVSVVRLDGNNAGARTIKFEHPICQVEFMDKHGQTALISTTAHIFLLHRNTDGFTKTPVGHTPRDGRFGATAHAFAKAAAPESSDGAGFRESQFSEDTVPKKDGVDDKKTWWMFASRPGRRLWVCRASTHGEVFETEVVATVRPLLPPAPSLHPFGRAAFGAPCDTETKESAQTATHPRDPRTPRRPKKWEFGELHQIGPCLLSVSPSAIAVIDILNASVLAWYPLAKPSPKPSPDGTGKGSGSNDSTTASSGVAFRDVCTFGASTFALGADGGVWCLQTPSTLKALAATSFLGSRATAGTESFPTTQRNPAQHLARMADRLRRVLGEEACGVGMQSRTLATKEHPSGTWSNTETADTENTSPVPGTVVDPTDIPVETEQPSLCDTPTREEPPSEALPEPCPEPTTTKPTNEPSTEPGERTPIPTHESTPAAACEIGKYFPFTTFRRLNAHTGLTFLFLQSGFITRGKMNSRSRGGDKKNQDCLVPASPQIDRPSSPFPVIVDGVVIALVDANASPFGGAAFIAVGDLKNQEDEAPSPSTTLRLNPSISSDEHSPKSETENASTSHPGSPKSRGLSLDASGEDDDPDAPSSPQANETNQLFQADLNPWWMRVMGCEGCGPVRSNKRENCL